MRSLGLGYWEIDMVLVVCNGAGAFLLPLSLRTTPSIKSAVLAQIVPYVPAAILIPISEGSLVIAMIVVMALGESTSYIVLESLVSQAVRRSENIVTAVLLHAPRARFDW